MLSPRSSRNGAASSLLYLQSTQGRLPRSRTRITHKTRSAWRLRTTIPQLRSPGKLVRYFKGNIGGESQRVQKATVTLHNVNRENKVCASPETAPPRTHHHPLPDNGTEEQSETVFPGGSYLTAHEPSREQNEYEICCARNGQTCLASSV